MVFERFDPVGITKKGDNIGLIHWQLSEDYNSFLMPVLQIDDSLKQIS